MIWSGSGCSFGSSSGRVSLQHLNEFGVSGSESVVVKEVVPSMVILRCAGQ